VAWIAADAVGWSEGMVAIAPMRQGPRLIL